MHLYEAHLPVADTIASEKFYREVVGLTFTYRDPTRDIVFLWANAREQLMLGLWGPGTEYGLRIEDSRRKPQSKVEIETRNSEAGHKSGMPTENHQ